MSAFLEPAYGARSLADVLPAVSHALGAPSATDGAVVTLDLPQVSSLDLSLILAGAEHCTVLTARARVDPVADPRSDWFVRRLPAAVEDTVPG